MGIGCQSHRTPVAKRALPQYLVIVHLAGRNQMITISAGPNGPLYSARTRAGAALFSNVTLNELRARHPDIYCQIDPAFAEADCSARMSR